MARRWVALLVGFTLPCFITPPGSRAQETAPRSASAPASAAELPHVITSTSRMPGVTPAEERVPANVTVSPRSRSASPTASAGRT